MPRTWLRIFFVGVFCLFVHASADAQNPIADEPAPTKAFQNSALTLCSTTTKSVDLREPIAKFAVARKIPVAEARKQALAFLGLSPGLSTRRFELDEIAFQPTDSDQFDITAHPQFFELLPAMLRSLELGKKQVLIHVHTFAVAPTQSNRINGFIEPGTATINCTQFPEIVPTATSRSMGNDDDSESFVSTTMKVRENLPVTTGHITLQDLAKLEKYVKDSSTANVTIAPTVSVLPGQVAMVNDISLRPFVVGIEAVELRNGIFANQPIIQTLEVGTMMHLKAIPRNDKIQLIADIAISKLLDVRSFSFSAAGEKNRQAIQLPKQSVRQVSLSQLLDADRALFIDPNFKRQTKTTDRKGRSLEVQQKVLFAIRAELIDVESVTGQRFGISGSLSAR